MRRHQESGWGLLALAIALSLVVTPVAHAAKAKPKKASRQPTAKATKGSSANRDKPAPGRGADDGVASQLKFSGLKLKGQLKKPDLSYIYKRKGLRAEQIVNIPEDFNQQIAQGDGQF